MEENKRRMLSLQAARIRKLTVEAVCAAGCGHPGGSLSIADILAYLYFDAMRVDPQNPAWPGRDRLVLSKGHAAPAYYSALALRGYFGQNELQSLRQLGSMLQGHPDMKKVPGVDMSTGSLGQGLSAANGMALAGRLRGRGNTVYCILGDGESQEGQVWEAVMTAAHYRLGNLVAFLDQNGLQIDGPVQQVMNNAPYEDKFNAFGWHVQTVDGHDFAQLEAAVQAAKAEQGKPSAIVCRTTKGRGVSFMENQCAWHGAAPNPQQAQQARQELAAEIQKWEVK